MQPRIPKRYTTHVTESDRPHISLDDSISSLGYEYEPPSPPRSPNPLLWAIAIGLAITALSLTLFASDVL